VKKCQEHMDDKPFHSSFHARLVMEKTLINEHEGKSVPSTFHFAYMVYFLNKVMDKALVDRDAVGGLSGDDMIVIEGSNFFM
jgi:hypothetical protein